MTTKWMLLKRSLPFQCLKVFTNIDENMCVGSFIKNKINAPQRIDKNINVPNYLPERP